MKKYYTFVILFLTLVNSNIYSQTDVYLKVYQKTFQRMEIDLYPFVGESPKRNSETIAKLITDVLSNDLWMSGYFVVNIKTGDPQSIASTSTNINDDNSNALAIVSGDFRTQGNKISIQPHVMDKASGRTIIKNTYDDLVGNDRFIIHNISDDIVYSLTGESGIARSKIAFVTQKRDGTKEISLMDYDGYNEQELTSDKSLNLSPAWSPDGRKICYTSYKNLNQNLIEINLQSNVQKIISNLKGLNSAPAWSPDGKKIALTLSIDENAEIYILEIKKNELRRLTYNRAIDSSPAWSASNREVAFTSDRAGSPQIYIMDFDGMNVRRLTFEGSYNDSPTWSSKGDKIAFVSRTDSGFDIYTIDVNGENLMRLTDSSGSNEDPSWSPNGFALTFSSTRNGKKEIFSMFWDGSDQKRINSGGIYYLPAWSPRLR